MLAALGFCLGVGQPLSMTTVVQAAPDGARSTALALRLTGNRLGQVAAPAAAGLVAGVAGTAAPFVMLGVLLLLSAGVALRSPGPPGRGRGRTRGKRPERPGLRRRAISDGASGVDAPDRCAHVKGESCRKSDLYENRLNRRSAHAHPDTPTYLPRSRRGATASSPPSPRPARPGWRRRPRPPWARTATSGSTAWACLSASRRTIPGSASSTSMPSTSTMLATIAYTITPSLRCPAPPPSPAPSSSPGAPVTPTRWGWRTADSTKITWIVAGVPKEKVFRVNCHDGRHGGGAPARATRSRTGRATARGLEQGTTPDGPKGGVHAGGGGLVDTAAAFAPVTAAGAVGLVAVGGVAYFRLNRRRPNGAA